LGKNTALQQTAKTKSYVLIN